MPVNGIFVDEGSLFMNVRQNLLSSIVSVLDLPAGYELAMSAEIAEIPGWDSMAWINVVAAIEEWSGKEFPIEKIADIKTIDDLIKAI